MIHKIICRDSDELSQQFADWLVGVVKRVLTKKHRFTIALSGGSTPKKLFKLLASDSYKNRIDWSRVHCFWGDERFVPFQDEKNNARMAFEELLSKVPVKEEQVHIMPTELEPADAVKAYERILHEYFDGDEKTFDVVMLGLGDNSHTLSLFPGYPVVHEQHDWVSAFFLKEQDMYRITLTSAVVNRSSAIAYLVSGADKAAAVEAVLEGARDADQHPAQVIAAKEGETYWFLDEAAAAKLKNKKRPG